MQIGMWDEARGLSSPLLFNLYVNALIEGLCSMHVGYFVDRFTYNVTKTEYTNEP